MLVAACGQNTTEPVSSLPVTTVRVTIQETTVTDSTPETTVTSATETDTPRAEVTVETREIQRMDGGVAACVIRLEHRLVFPDRPPTPEEKAFIIAGNKRLAEQGSPQTPQLTTRPTTHHPTCNPPLWEGHLGLEYGWFEPGGEPVAVRRKPGFSLADHVGLRAR